jgi:hypothetical protein
MSDKHLEQEFNAKLDEYTTVPVINTKSGQCINTNQRADIEIDKNGATADFAATRTPINWRSRAPPELKPLSYSGISIDHNSDQYKRILEALTNPVIPHA